jgi:DNA-binding protein HU-beta
LKKRNSVSKKSLIISIARKTKITRADVAIVLDHFLGEMIIQFNRGKMIELRGFGTFSPYYKKPRSYIIPRLADKAEMKGRTTLKFKPSRQIIQYEEAVDESL